MCTCAYVCVCEKEIFSHRMIRMTRRNRNVKSELSYRTLHEVSRREGILSVIVKGFPLVFAEWLMVRFVCVQERESQMYNGYICENLGDPIFLKSPVNQFIDSQKEKSLHGKKTTVFLYKDLYTHIYTYMFIGSSIYK